MGGGMDMDVPYQDEDEPDTDQLHFDSDVAEQKKKGLPFPDPAHPAVSADRLDMEALWQALTEDDKERIGVLALGIIVGGTIATLAEMTAPAASRAGVAHSHLCMEELCNGELEPPAAVELALRGPSWRLPASIGPICTGCGCTEVDACIDGYGNACGWADEAETLCTHCHTPPPRPPSTDDDIPF